MLQDACLVSFTKLQGQSIALLWGKAEGQNHQTGKCRFLYCIILSATIKVQLQKKE